MNGRPRNGNPSVSAGNPLVGFLGPGAVSNGPFGVLGLPVRRVGEAEVLGAVHRAMTRIDAHPESRTPAANEARLAVHAAAANLLDRAVLEALLVRLTAGGARESVAPEPGRAGSEPLPPRNVELEADLLRSIAAEGGWSRSAMDRFLKVSHAKGHSTAEAVGAIGHLVHQSPARRPAPETAFSPMTDPARTEPSMADTRRTSVEEQGEPRLERAVDTEAMRTDREVVSPLGAVMLIGTVIVMMAVGGWFAVMSLRAGHGESEPAAQAPPPVREPTRPVALDPPIDPADADEPGRSARVLDNGPAIVHEFEVAIEGLSLDLEGSVDTFTGAVRAMADRWAGLSVSDRLAAQNQIIAFLYRVSGRAPLTTRAMDALDEGARALLDGPPLTAGVVRRGAWSMGTIVRLRREQNLPSAVIRRIDRVLLLAPEGFGPNEHTFRAGANAALRTAADTLAAQPVSEARTEAWSAWAESVRAASTGDRSLAESAVLGAVESVLRRSPSEDPDTDTIGLLVGELSWRPDGAARSWLLRKFGDRSVGATSLHTLTLALATRSTAAGVDHSMVLPRGASDYDRRTLGERFRALWGIEAGADQDETLASFLSLSGGALVAEPTLDGRDEVEILASVTRIARLNAAGSMLWRAETAGAGDVLTNLDQPIDAVLASADVPSVQSLFASSNGAWAETYLKAGANIQRRLDLLGRLGGNLEPMDAEVVAVEALRGSPQRVRDAAAAVIESGAAQPVVVNAMLEALPMMPKIERNATLVEIVAGVSLPPADAQGWEIEARRALVERLLELIAGHGMYARLDALSGLLGDAYALRLAGRGGGPSGALRTPDAAQTARALSERWAADAGARPPAGLTGMGADDIARRRTARLAMASGLVQRFHVEQLALLELMAQTVAGELPDRAGAVRAILDDVIVERSRATSVLVQIEIAERAMLRMWRVRFGEVTA